GRARGGQEILGAIGNAVERAPVPPRRDFPFCAPRLAQCALAGDGDHGVVLRAQALEPIEVELGQRHGRELARAHEGGQLAHGLEEKLGAHGSPRYAVKAWKGSSAVLSLTARSARAAPTWPSSIVL